MSQPWRDGRVPGDVVLAYGRTGDGPQPVLALHGITSNHRAFGGVARHLRHPDGVVALDLRGRGRSAKLPAGNYGLAAHAADVIRTLDHLGIERAVIVGHSMGGFVATYVAATWPERVRALALLDGGWPRGRLPTVSLDPAMWAGLRKAINRLDRRFTTVDEYLEYWKPGVPASELPTEVLDAYTYDLESTPGGFRVSVSRSAADEDARSAYWHSPTAWRLRRVQCPVLLVRAGAGFAPGTLPLFSAQNRDAVTAVLDVRRDLLLPAADHYSMLVGEHAASIAAALDWLLELDVVAHPPPAPESKARAAWRRLRLRASTAASMLNLRPRVAGQE